MRIGHGYDVHRLAEGLPFTLGGVVIPHTKGFVAHSDGDVLIHAIIDALFGAAGLPDIGAHFPDSDVRYKGVSSISLLTECICKIRSAGFEIEYIDSTVIAQAPKIGVHIPAMREQLACALRISMDQINIKATTEEKLGFTGTGEGVAAHAVCLLK